MRGRSVWARSECGQSLIELALALPFLVLIFVGVADAARVFYYTTAITNAAREGAAYAARTRTATDSSVALRVCAETGFLDCSSGVPSRLQVRRVASGSDEKVSVSYDFDFVGAYIVSAVFRANPLRIQASSTFPTMR